MTNELIKGYHRFRQNRWPSERAEYEALATNGQKPHTLVVACSDSRADPALIFDTAPGELFVVRNVANLVPPYQPDGKLHGVSAALEFGVNAMLKGSPANCQDFVAPWVEQAAPTVRRVVEDFPAEQVERVAEETVVRLSIDNLRTFPWIAEKEAAGKLALSGLHFGIADGILSKLTGGARFEQLD